MKGEKTFPPDKVRSFPFNCYHENRSNTLLAYQRLKLNFFSFFWYVYFLWRQNLNHALLWSDNKFYKNMHFEAEPNTAQKWEWLPLLGRKSLATIFDFFSLSVVSKTAEKGNFTTKWPNANSKVHTQRMLYLKVKLIFYSKPY